MRANNERIKRANNFIHGLLRLIMRPILALKYRLKFDRTVTKHIKSPCIIVSNHSTVADQFIVGCMFRFGINFVASDSLLRRGNLLSFLIRTLGRAIPIRKGSADASTVKNMISIVKQGGSVALFPEGNRTFFGETSYFVPTIGKLAKVLGVPLVILNIEGGFATQSRWSAGLNKGKMRVYARRVLSGDELSALSAEKINETIKNELYFNEFDYIKNSGVRFSGKHMAENLETALFYCPICHSLTTNHSLGNTITCTKCGAHATIGSDFTFTNKTSGIPDTILDWSRLQLDYIKNYDFAQYTETPVFSDDNMELYTFTRAEKDTFVSRGTVALFATHLQAAGQRFDIADINGLAIQENNKLQFSYQNSEFYIKIGSPKTSLMKYMICLHKIKQDLEGVHNEYFGY
jgi:1-acyl-sn-glycerol-3-phosphate acyltransferase